MASLNEATLIESLRKRVREGDDKAKLQKELGQEYYIYLKEHKKFKPNTIQKKFRSKEKLNRDLDFKIKEPEENKELVKLQCELSKQSKREDQVIIDATILIDRIIDGLKEALKYEIYPQVLFCMNFILCGRANDLNIKRIRGDGTHSSKDTHFVLENYIYKEQEIIGTIVNLLTSKNQNKNHVKEISLPMICHSEHYGLVKTGLDFLMSEEKADMKCYSSVIAYKNKDKCGAPKFKHGQRQNEWKHIRPCMVTRLKLKDAILKSPEKWKFDFSNCTGRDFVASFVADGSFEKGGLGNNLVHETVLGHTGDSSANAAYEKIKLKNMPKYDVVLKKIDPTEPLKIGHRSIANGLYLTKNSE